MTILCVSLRHIARLKMNHPTEAGTVEEHPHTVLQADIHMVAAVDVDSEEPAT